MGWRPGSPVRNAAVSRAVCCIEANSFDSSGYRSRDLAFAEIEEEDSRGEGRY